MSLDLEERLKRFQASAPQTIREIEVLELSHSAMSKTYHLWKEPYAGQVTLETGAVVDVACINMEIRQAGSEAHLDQTFDISICTVDAEDEFRRELDAISLDTEERIIAIYRAYLSNDLTEPQAVGRLQVENISHAKGAAKIAAVSPRLNVTRTGELYSFREFPPLRGFI